MAWGKKNTNALQHTSNQAATKALKATKPSTKALPKGKGTVRSASNAQRKKSGQS
jgi:hypothetical protein